ncbi:muskelin [Backusella circina FSU 941]|nr:muskelin [Backusella circina FSU 941]
MNRASQLSNKSNKTNTNLTFLITAAPQVTLPYSIHNYSSFSGTYHPENIAVNNPNEQASRWSSGVHDSEQFITITFKSPVIARSIIFGKYYKGHVCNLKEFKIYGGMNSDDEMIEILHDGLKNNAEPESFPLKHQHRNLIFPVKYIKIVPLTAYVASFNYSIWFVEVKGISNDAIMQRVVSEYENYKEMETTRLCLKYFRQKNMMDVFYVLKNRTGAELEHPLLSDLHRYLVVQGDFGVAENILDQLYQSDMYKPFSDNATYKPIWKQILATNEDGDSPCARGGHQMCIDTMEGMIYVIGGWDGRRDLSDFWCFNIRLNEWELLSHDTKLQGGPGPRSCHKICFDPISKSIFVLGRYVEPQAVSNCKDLESDFYRYYIEFDQWIKISDHTAREGGPELIFDHQVCIDAESETLYVFGGRTVNGDINFQNYSGLYSYQIKTNQWKLIRNDDAKLKNQAPPPINLNNSDGTRNHTTSTFLKSRVGHSMLFDKSSKSLYIFAGQRIKDYLSDMYRYSIDHDIVTEIIPQELRNEIGGGPDAGFTQRVTIDEDAQELYVLSGYMRKPSSDIVKNALWVYSIKENKWKKIYQNENVKLTDELPCPRFAHQMVYNTNTKVHYIFGGNPGDHTDSSKRLDDFWELKLTKPNPASILRYNTYQLRLQKFRELCENRTMDEATHIALDYLRTQLAPIVNHEDEEESSQFHQMCANLCLLNREQDEPTSKTQDLLFIERTQLFEKLLECIPQEMKEPQGKIINTIKLT